MLPSLCHSPFAVETLVLRGLWGEMRERRTLPWKEQQRKAKYLAGSLPQSGIMGQRLSSLWELRPWVLTGLGPMWLHPQTLLFIDSIIRARKCKHIQVFACQPYPKRRYLYAYEYHRNSFFPSSIQCYTRSFWAPLDSCLVFLLGYCIIIIITEEDISFCSLWIKGKQSVSIFSEWQQRHLCPALQVKPSSIHTHRTWSVPTTQGKS